MYYILKCAVLFTNPTKGAYRHIEICVHTTATGSYKCKCMNIFCNITATTGGASGSQMGCISTRLPPMYENPLERSAHVRRKTQHLQQNLVHEEFKLRVDEVRGRSLSGSPWPLNFQIYRSHISNLWPNF